MTLYGTIDFLMCRTFPMTLRGMAREWFAKLPRKLISSFSQRVRKFKLNFVNYKLLKRTTNSLYDIRQEEKEQLESYTRRFNEEVHLVTDPTPFILINAYINGLQFSRFFYKVIAQPPTISRRPKGHSDHHYNLVELSESTRLPHVGLRPRHVDPIAVITEHDQLSNHAQIYSPIEGGMLCTPPYIATPALVSP